MTAKKPDRPPLGWDVLCFLVLEELF